jgi:hypothetical protein
MKDNLDYDNVCFVTPLSERSQEQNDLPRIGQSLISKPLVLHPECWGEMPPLHPINLNIKSEKIAALRLKSRRDSLWLTTSTSESPTPPLALAPTVLPVMTAPQPIKKQLHRPSPLVRIPEMGRVNIPHYEEKSISQLLGLS